MPNSFLLQIITPDRNFYDGEADQLTVTTSHGQIGVLYNIMPLVTILKTGKMRIFTKGKWMDANAGNGYLAVRQNKVAILVDKCYWAHESIPEVEENIDDEEELEKKRQSLREHEMAKAQLARKLARLGKQAGE